VSSLLQSNVRINATVVENKCNFLTFLLQQKLVLLITLCFVLADDLRINILKFVAGHYTVVQPASINIVFGCKQAQQYSKHIIWVYLSSHLECTKC